MIPQKEKKYLFSLDVLSWFSFAKSFMESFIKECKLFFYHSYKVPYKNISSSSMELYTDPITPLLFSTFFSAAIGYIRMDDADTEV